MENKDFSIYKYYKGEKEDPFYNILKKHISVEKKFYDEYNLPIEEVKKLELSSLFWCMEQTFHIKYTNFTSEDWSSFYRESIDEVKKWNQEKLFDGFLDIYFIRHSDIKKYYFP